MFGNLPEITQLISGGVSLRSLASQNDHRETGVKCVTPLIPVFSPAELASPVPL